VQEPGEELAQALPGGGLDKLGEGLRVVYIEDLEGVGHVVTLDAADRTAGNPDTHERPSPKP
jgi:hypothetical protein